MCTECNDTKQVKRSDIMIIITGEEYRPCPYCTDYYIKTIKKVDKYWKKINNNKEGKPNKDNEILPSDSIL